MCMAFSNNCVYHFILFLIHLNLERNEYNGFFFSFLCLIFKIAKWISYPIAVCVTFTNSFTFNCLRIMFFVLFYIIFYSYFF